MNLYTEILFFVSGINVVLAVLFFLSTKKTKSNIVFSFFVLFVALWAAGIAFFINSPNISTSIGIANTYYISGGMIGTLFLFFSHLFLSENKLSKVKMLVLSIPMLVYICLFIFNKNIFIEQIYFDDFGKNVILNKEPYILFLFYFATYILYAYWNLFTKKLTLRDATHKKQINIVIISTIIGFLFSFVFNLYLPLIGIYHLIWIGPLFGFLMAGTIFYAIAKYQLFNIKTVTTEFFVFALWIAVFIEILLENNPLQQLRSIVLLVLLIFFGILLIRSVIKEIQQREQLQVFKDALQKSNEDLEYANSQLRGLDKMKTEFLSLASHQLRSPLTSIKGYASLLIEGSYGEMADGQKEAVKRIYTSAQGLVSIVEDLLNVSKIEQGGMKFQFSKIDILKLVRDLYNEMLIPAENKKLILNFNVEDRIQDYTVSADETKLRQVFLNLVDNAIKYTKEGYVSIILSSTAKEIRFSVKDSGLGVTPDTKKKLFQKFSRGEAGRLNTGGSGLGLYIAQKIIEAHNGTISIESEGEGKGSLFTVTIPR